MNHIPIHIKHYRVLTFSLVVFSWINLWAQETEPTIAVLARATSDSIMLRWSPTQPLLWKEGNRVGYHIQRTTLTRNGELLQNSKAIRLTSAPIVPKPLYHWEALAKENENAAVLAQAIFGSTFNTVAPGSNTGAIMAINDENEQRFTFALLAAEQSFAAAKLGGLGFVDTDVDSNETYVYKISLAKGPARNEEPVEGSVMTGLSYQERLPVPIGATIVPGDEEIVLEWNYSMLKRFYSRYIIEKSENGSSFHRLEARPIFNVQSNNQEQNLSLIYKDSVPNGKQFYYRISGQTAFDETGPPTKILSATALPTPKYAPVIEKKIFEGKDGVRIIWSFDPEEEKSIKGFQLRRSNTHKGDFKDVGALLSPKTRETRYAPLQRSNYFKVVAIGINDVERPSFPFLVQPVDSIPPKPPIGLKGSIDTTGVVRLSWTQNTEKDLLGYRVYRSYNPSVEFSQVTSVELKENSFLDTLNLKTLNRKVFYKVLAEDQRYNASKLSETLALSLPDLTPPSPPVITKYQSTEVGIQLTWIPSTSNDVVSHTVYRATSGQNEVKWQKLYESKDIKDTTFLDTEELNTNIYSYTIIAKDTSGIESAPSKPISVERLENVTEKNVLTFTGTPNRKLRFIHLSWKTKEHKIVEYKLYKGTSKENLRLYKTLKGQTKGYNDVSLTVNTSYTYGLQALLESGQLSPIKLIEVKY